ncbi:nucleotide sugar dehydrogenase [Thermincola ferriacetica]|uniref:Nucleotide sugar dehydrogenase n=2 Tax=Thermincola TaxID=278993 RepID=D5X8Q9_THEPJ|nr:MULTISPECIES: nucleotide sugar dehydrogenase [Thermincola]ADG82935.1 nucleotide sugar dehydrogenase [Thermincola potens JR]KNZ68546.1 nucleotide sugar dehydrogenase [Thermincola ferriacetica]
MSNSSKNVKVAIFGLGFVGLPLALSYALRGCEVIGVDVDPHLVDQLNNGITHHLEKYHDIPIQQVLKDMLAAKRFSATLDAGHALKECNNFILTIGIPVTDKGHDFSHVESCSRAVASGLKPGDLVIVRSTLIPGMTRNFVKPILEESGLKAGEDFYLAYSSERIAEGKAFDEFENMPTLVSGINEASLQKAMELMSIVTKAELVPASSFEVVESAKVMENISRDVNIAMVNEFARFTKALGIDIFEVIKVANTHKRVKLLIPGPGVGGYCIPNALHYLAPKADELGVPLKLLRTARKINEEVPAFVASLVTKNLPVPPSKAKVAALGIAMKDYSSDDRQSPALDVIKILLNSGIKVAAFDPAVPSKHAFQVDSLEAAVKDAHGIIVLAKQNGIGYNNFKLFNELMSKVGTPFIVDTKNLYNRDEVEAAGFKLESL